jgi:MFS family permease
LAAFYPFTPSHLLDLGLERTSAWMTLGQVTEIIAMLGLARVLTRWRLKWIFACGLGFALLRYVLCALDGKGWVLAGVTLHGFAFTLFFVTAPIYLNERIDAAWRTRAQALFTLMTSGAGNLIGYLGTGWWFAACQRADGMHWPLFWSGLAAAVACVLVYFLIAYHGRGGQPMSPSTTRNET